MKNRAIFFDRDGIVNKRIIGDYIKNTDEFEFIPFFIDLFKLIKGLNFSAIIISNQQGVGKGIMSFDDLNSVTDFMQLRLELETGFKFDDIYYCTDLHDSQSFNRKPNPGMILNAISKWKIDRANSYMIGDSLTDVQAGKAASVQTMLIGDYNRKNAPEANFIFSSLAEVVDFFMDMYDQ
ncbi:MAG: HAD-IIIA family hydrolase [Candidatus Kapabacteria bacterium]|nr:HAD-IIIA family hydrolase [Candidatus Kapabacteria bacterium]